MRVRAAIGLAVFLAGAVPPTVRADAPTKYSLDDLGRLASVTTEIGTTKYKYFDSGSIEEMVDPGGWRYSFSEGDAPSTLASAAPNFLPSFATAVSSPLDQSANRFLFTGFMYERELGLYLTPSGRLYDPLSGRFIQQDSHLGTLSDPPSLHRYLYGHNNPVRFIDPTGHSDEGANRLAAAMHRRTGVLASDHRPAEQRGWWYNAFSYVYQDLPPRLIPMEQFEGLARQDAKEFAVGTAETVVAAAVPPAVKRGAGALVERFPVLGKSVTEAAGEALERLRVSAPAEPPATPVRTVSVSEAAKSGGTFVATEDGRLAPAAPRIAGGSQGADSIADAANSPWKSKYWSEGEFEGTKVYQRNDLIDPAKVDARGRTNLQRMEKGLSPLGPDGKPINLHHVLQTEKGPVAELTQTFHQQNKGIIHVNPSTTASGIDRSAFDAWRAEYWKSRAQDFVPK